MTTNLITERLTESIATTDATLNRTTELLAAFNRVAREKLNEKIMKRLHAACPDCSPNYPPVACEAYYLEGQGVFVEPASCLVCGGWKLAPSVSEAAHAA